MTAREYAQTLELLRLHGIGHHVIGPRHGGAARRGKARALLGRLRALRSFAVPREFDVALTHGSHELTMTARALSIPCSTSFDYEWAWLQHQLGCRSANLVVVPEAIPARRLRRYGVRGSKLVRYEGLKEEYYLSDFEPDPAVPARLGLDRERVLAVVRTPPEVSLYHRHGNPLFTQVLERLGNDAGVHAVVLPRTHEQRDAIRALALPSLVVPEGALDAQSLIALSDLVVSAGGTMNREAVALGVPVYTTFAGRLGAVDEQLIGEGRLTPLRDAGELILRKREESGLERVRRDPRDFLDALLPT